MKIYASRNSGSNVTIGDIYEITVSKNMAKAAIKDYDGRNYRLIYEGLLEDALRQFPELKNARIVKFDAFGAFEYDIAINADFDYD